MCGADLNNGKIVNSDHCPPEKLFHPSDRIDYPIKVKVHASCNHKWNEDDEKLSIFFDVLHGGIKVNNPELLKKLSFLSVITAQGVYIRNNLLSAPTACSPDNPLRPCAALRRIPPKGDA